MHLKKKQKYWEDIQHKFNSGVCMVALKDSLKINNFKYFFGIIFLFSFFYCNKHIIFFFGHAAHFVGS